MSQPDILWIVTTQWRAQAFGYAGDPNARTPRLDGLAAGSWNFAQAVTPHPFGPFARAAMLTGVLSPENGVREYFDPLPAASRTVAHQMAESGYSTAFFGKWHLARRDPSAPLVGEAHARTRVPPENRGGFHLWEGFESGHLLNDPWLHGTRLPEPVRFGGYQADVLCQRAADWLEGPAGRPRFCVVSLEAPHPPYDAPSAGISPRDPGSLILPANVPEGEAAARARRELAGYYAHLEATDRAVGRLLDRLSPKRPAAVLFTSVHGDMHGAHGLFRKGWPYEECVRIPLLVRTPSGGARVVPEPMSLAYLPALTRLLAAGREPKAPGRPGIRALLSMPSVVRLPLQCDRPWAGVRTADRKLIVNPDGSPWLFFDLQADPMEMNNLAGDPGRADEIRSLRPPA